MLEAKGECTERITTTMRRTHYRMGFQAIKFPRLRFVLERKKELDKYHNR